MVTTKHTDQMYASVRTVITDEKPTLTRSELLSAYPVMHTYDPAIVGEYPATPFRMDVPLGKSIKFLVRGDDNRSLPLWLWRYVDDVFILVGTGSYVLNTAHVLENRSAFDLAVTAGGTELPEPARRGRLRTVDPNCIRSGRVCRDIEYEPGKVVFFVGDHVLLLPGTLLPVRGRTPGWGIAPKDTSDWHGVTWPADALIQSGAVTPDVRLDTKAHTSYPDVLRYLSENN